MSDPDRMLADWQEQIERKLRQADQLQVATTDIRVVKTSQDASVTVTVDATGTMVDLELTDAAWRNSPSALSVLILATQRDAQSALADRVKTTVSPLIGEDSETMRMLMAGYSGRFGGLTAQPKRNDVHDDDNSQRTWLSRDRGN